MMIKLFQVKNVEYWATVNSNSVQNHLR